MPTQGSQRLESQPLFARDGSDTRTVYAAATASALRARASAAWTPSPTSGPAAPVLFTAAAHATIHANTRAAEYIYSATQPHASRVFGVFKRTGPANPSAQHRAAQHFHGRRRGLAKHNNRAAGRG